MLATIVGLLFIVFNVLAVWLLRLHMNKRIKHLNITWFDALCVWAGTLLTGYMLIVLANEVGKWLLSL